MEQTSTEEVKDLLQRRGDRKVADGHGCSCPIASDLKVTALQRR
jgi:hypothetical protein